MTVNLLTSFSATQTSRLCSTIRVRDVICTGKAFVTFRGQRYIMSYGVKSKTVHSIVAA